MTLTSCSSGRPTRWPPLGRSRLAELVGQRIWMPGMLPGSEWDIYFDDLADAFGLTIERVGPFFGNEHLLDVLADSSTLANLAGEHTRILWPDHYDLRRIPIRHPTPVYPHLADLAPRQPPSRARHPSRLSRRHSRRGPDADTWAPAWAQRKPG